MRDVTQSWECRNHNTSAIFTSSCASSTAPLSSLVAIVAFIPVTEASINNGGPEKVITAVIPSRDETSSKTVPW